MGKLSDTIKKQVGIPEGPIFTAKRVLTAASFILDVLLELKRRREAAPKAPARPSAAFGLSSKAKGFTTRLFVRKKKPVRKWYVRWDGDHFSAGRCVSR